MILGILSDSHGQHERTARAIRLLQQCGAEAFVHCGDIGGEQVLDQLAGLRVRFVWGNTDVVDASIVRYARSLGLTPPEGTPLRIESASRIIEVFHGHEPEFARLTRRLTRDASSATPASSPRYVLYGHTHYAADARFGAVRVINPGALHRARAYTVATLELTGDTLRFWQVDDAAPDTARPQPYQPR